MKDQLQAIELAFSQDIASATDSASLEQLRVQYLGRKAGKLTAILRTIKDLPEAEKKAIGALANTVRVRIEEQLEEADKRLAGTDFQHSDLTLPGITPSIGHLHPITQLLNELLDIFQSMGFMVYEGPELEHDYYNFEALNFPPGHPAREIQDTFFIRTPIERNEDRRFESGQWVMRTHTSNMQIRVMEQHEPPLRCVIPGRVFRNEATDAKHEHTFYQLEGFVVDTNITIGNLIWSLKEIFRQYYKTDVRVRLRPGFFPFTEPSYEIDMSCVFCNQQKKDCRVCKGTGWVEMGGSGMIHPNVFKAVGYEDGKYTGFAFGMGTMRLAMLKHGISDIRMFMQNDIRFLEQF